MAEAKSKRGPRLLVMEHPNLKKDDGSLRTAPTTRVAFEKIWKAKGWRLREDKGGEAGSAASATAPGSKPKGN